jgi:hypothetical protein
VPASEPEDAQKNRAEKRQWLAEHEYRVVALAIDEVERDLDAALDTLAAALPSGG